MPSDTVSELSVLSAISVENAVIAVLPVVLFLGVERKRKIAVAGAFVGVDGQFLEGAAEHTGQRIAELLGSLGIAVIVVIAPGFVDVIYLAGRAGIFDAAGLRSFGHALVVKADNCVVFAHISISRLTDGIRLGEAVAVGDDSLQSLDSFVNDAFTLGIQLVEQVLVLSVLGDDIGTFLKPPCSWQRRQSNENTACRTASEAAAKHAG